MLTFAKHFCFFSIVSATNTANVPQKPLAVTAAPQKKSTTPAFSTLPVKVDDAKDTTKSQPFSTAQSSYLKATFTSTPTTDSKKNVTGICLDCVINKKFGKIEVSAGPGSEQTWIKLPDGRKIVLDTKVLVDGVENKLLKEKFNTSLIVKYQSEDAFITAGASGEGQAAFISYTPKQKNLPKVVLTACGKKFMCMTAEEQETGEGLIVRRSTRYETGKSGFVLASANNGETIALSGVYLDLFTESYQVVREDGSVIEQGGKMFMSGVETRPLQKGERLLLVKQPMFKRPILNPFAMFCWLLLLFLVIYLVLRVCFGKTPDSGLESTRTKKYVFTDDEAEATEDLLEPTDEAAAGEATADEGEN